MNFRYKAITQQKKIERGTIEAASLSDATLALIKKGWYVRKISPQGGGKSAFFSTSFGGKVSLLNRALFAKHLATMIRSGISIHESLDAIADQTRSSSFRQILESVTKDVRSGLRLADSLERYPKAFDPLMINIIKVGEESGTLDDNLDFLATELEQQVDLRRKIKGAAFYPSIVLGATFGLGIILAYFVFPKITQLFVTLNFELPATTRFLLWIADVMDSYGLYIIFGLIGAFIGLRILVTIAPFKGWWHRFVLHLPVVGSIVRNYNLTLINRTLGILLHSGLTIDQAIIATTATTKNVVYQKMLQRVLPEVQRGQTFSGALRQMKQDKRNSYFSLLSVKMIGVGERTGKLDESFTYLSEFFGKEVDTATKNLSTTIEPLLLLFIGLIVGFVAVSVISPIYEVTSQFRAR